jgi:3-(3-hydroxy-phenyl)propionate hydroxylase
MKTDTFDHSTQSVIQTEVLVVGHGPVGAALSCFLGQMGIGTLIIDKAAGILNMPRAIALDNEALRILQHAGLADDAFEKRPIQEVLMHSPYAHLFGKACTKGGIDGHPKLVTFYQPDLEAALRKKAKEYGFINLIENTELIGFQDHGDHIIAEAVNTSQTKIKIKAQYLIGADGANSLVRKLIGQTFEGETYAEDWLIVDVNQRNNVDMQTVEFVCNPDLPTPHMPAPGGRERWEFMLHKDQSRDEALQDDYIRKLIHPWVGDEPVSIERKAVYRFHARCADSFSKGRTFLVGDAAHITPPFVGQGLVAGLRDACNLSWKLALAVKGFTRPQLLDSYDIERRPHAREMINMAKMMGSMVMPSSHIKAMVVHNLMRLLRVWSKSRAYFEDLQIKPKNQFKQGFFLPQWKVTRSGLKNGSPLPQGMGRNAEGEVKWTDEWIGRKFTLIGFGLDPLQGVNASNLEKLSSLPMNRVRLQPLGARPEAGCIEDLSGTFLQGMKRNGLIALVRPDRFVMAHCEPKRLNEMLSDCLELLR